jgi:hypothetical protein
MLDAFLVVGLSFPAAGFFLLWGLAAVGVGLLCGRRAWNLMLFHYLGWSLCLLVLLAFPGLSTDPCGPECTLNAGPVRSAAPRQLRVVCRLPAPLLREGNPPPLSATPADDSGTTLSPSGNADSAPLFPLESLPTTPPITPPAAVEDAGTDALPRTNAEEEPVKPWWWRAVVFWLLAAGFPALTVLCLALVVLRNNTFSWRAYRLRARCDRLAADFAAGPSFQALDSVPAEPGSTLPRLAWNGGTAALTDCARAPSAFLLFLARRLCALGLPTSYVAGRTALVFRHEVKPGKHFLALFTAEAAGTVLTLRWGWAVRESSDLSVLLPLSSSLNTLMALGRGSGVRLLLAPVLIPVLLPWNLLALAWAYPARAASACFWRCACSEGQERPLFRTDVTRPLGELLAARIEDPVRAALADFAAR